MTECYKLSELFIIYELRTRKHRCYFFQNVAKGLLLFLKNHYLHHLFESAVTTLKLTAFYVQVTLLDVKWKIPQVHVAVHSNRISKNRIKKKTFKG